MTEHHHQASLNIGIGLYVAAPAPQLVVERLKMPRTSAVAVRKN